MDGVIEVSVSDKVDTGGTPSWTGSTFEAKWSSAEAHGTISIYYCFVRVDKGGALPFHNSVGNFSDVGSGILAQKDVGKLGRRNSEGLLVGSNAIPAKDVVRDGDQVVLTPV